MSPEQLEAEPLDHRTDIFAFGTMLYESVAGKHPFEGKSPGSTIGNILKERPKDQVRLTAAVSPELQRVILKCVRKDKEQRYQTVRLLLADLEAAMLDKDGAPGFEDDGLAQRDFRLASGTARRLFLLAQCGYIALYLTAMYYGEAISQMLPGPATFSIVIVSAMCGVAMRLYLISSVGFRHTAAPKQFRRLFPALLVLDALWAASPLFLWRSLGYVALGCVAVMTYLPFSQRTLMKSLGSHEWDKA
jgi:hypothetical protein